MKNYGIYGVKSKGRPSRWGIWLMVLLSTVSTHVCVRLQQKAHGSLGPMSCTEDTVPGMWEGLFWGPEELTVYFRGLAPCSHSPPIAPVQLSQTPARPSQWHFKVSPVAVTSAPRNVTGCFVSRHWLYPMCYYQRPPERNKNTPLRGSPGLLDCWLMR